MKKAFKTIASSVLAVFLIACGSNQTSSVENQLSAGVAVTTKNAEFGKPASAEVVKVMSEKLGSYFNGQHASNPKALMGTQTAAAKSSNGSSATPMIAPTNVASAVFRFYNTKSGAHFFTMSADERDYVQNTFPFFTFEGKSFLAYPDADPSLSPVYRFYNKVTGTHFFTISAEEKAYVETTWPAIFTFEGVSWYASTVQSAGWVPVYRFFNTKTGTHFYTTSADEKDYVLATWNWFTFEGVAYYVQPVPEPVACTADPIGSTGYSLVFKGCDANNVAQYYDKTECVRENATGLIWEGKPTSGDRANTKYFNNFDDTTKLQSVVQSYTGSPATNNLVIIQTPVAPTQAQIDSPANSIGYVNAVRSSNLCGFSDWRRPIAAELMALVKPGAAPTIDATWFPNTMAYHYWSSSPSIATADDRYASTLNFLNGLRSTWSRKIAIEAYPTDRAYLRLVR